MRKEGYGPNPADNPVDEYGDPIRSSQNFMKQPSSSKAKRYSTELRKNNLPREAAKRKAIRKMMDEMKKTGMIPASPTR